MFTVYIAAESLMTLLPLGTRVARVAVPANARGAPILRSVKLFGTIRGLLMFPFATFFLKYIRHWAKLVVFSFQLSEPVLRLLLEAGILLTTFWALSSVVANFFDYARAHQTIAEASRGEGVFESMKQVTLSIAWLVYAVTIVSLGIRRRSA